jgi:hypothetical protein
VLNIVLYIALRGNSIALMYLSDFLPVLCAFISCVCLFYAFKGFKEYDYAKVAWLLIFSGIFLDFMAESTYGILEIVYHIDMNNVFPTIADVFWCLGYIPLFIGLSMMLIGYKRSGLPMGNEKLYVFLTIIFMVISFVVVYFILLPIIQDKETDIISKIYYMFYPIADLIIVILAVLLMYITSLLGKGLVSRPWKFLYIGFVFFTIADLLYSYLSWQDLYGNGNLIDVAWHFGYLAVGLAGLYQTEVLESVKMEG